MQTTHFNSPYQVEKSFSVSKGLIRQLEPGSFSAVNHTYRGDFFILNRYSFSVDTLFAGQAQSPFAYFGFLTKKSDPTEVSFHYFAQGTVDYVDLIPKDTYFYGLAFSPELIQKNIPFKNGHNRFYNRSFYEDMSSDPSTSELGKILHEIIECGMEDPNKLEELITTISDGFNFSTRSEYTGLDRRERIVHSAAHLLFEKPQFRWTTEGLANACNCSERTLQYACAEQLNLKPKALIKAFAFNWCYNEIIVKGGELTSVISAMPAQYQSSPGRFSGEFKSFFGISPKRLARQVKLGNLV